MAVKAFLHCNSNIICSVNIKSTGLEWNYHEIWQVAVLPLNSDLKPSKEILPFCLTLKIEMPERADEKVISRQQIAASMVRGVDQGQATEMFVEWFEKKLDLIQGKRIMPVGCNYAFDQGFLRIWLGNKTYEQLFDPRYRDITSTSLYANDSAYFHQEQIPYPKNHLRYLASCLKVEYINTDDALENAVVIGECYRLMLKKLF